MLSGNGRHRERPATFRDVFASREYRAIYGAATLSWVGDSAARAAVTALVYHDTRSAAFSAAAFALTYAPWLLGGSLLVALAERYPHRSVMVICDVARVAIMAAVALPGVPLPGVLGLVLLAAFFAPPFDAARSASLPVVLTGPRYVLGVAISSSTNQPAQVAGYLIGAGLAISEPRLAFAFNAVTFAVSAALVRTGVRWREPALARARRSHLLRETAEGFQLVFGTPALRAIAVLVFGGVLFVAVPEGLGAAWAATLADGADRGWVQGMIMAAVPLGSIVGSLLATRLLPPAVLARLMRPLAIAVPLALVPALFAPPAVVVVLLGAACGAAMGVLSPVANGQFVRRLPAGYRARAFGVVQAGFHLLQGLAVLTTGLLAQRFAVPVVVGAWGLAGTAFMGALVLRWRLPSGDPTPTEPPVSGDGEHRGQAPVDQSAGVIPEQRWRGWGGRRPAAQPPGTMEP